MPLTDFEEELLGWLLDDYEAPQSLAGDLTRELGRSVTEDEVYAALVALVQKGLVLAYRFDDMLPGSAGVAVQ